MWIIGCDVHARFQQIAFLPLGPRMSSVLVPAGWLTTYKAALMEGFEPRLSNCPRLASPHCS